MKPISKTKLNIAVPLLNQAIVTAFRLVLARIILRTFGSENNGLMQTIDQLLSYTILLEGGIGGVVKAALYKPLAKRDADAISDIYHQVGKIFSRISVIFVVFVLLLSVCMKFLVGTHFTWQYVFAMVLILGGTTFVNYYFAMPQQLLMSADQKLYIIQLVQIVSTAINLPICLLVIHWGGGIHAVKLATLLTCLLNPLALRLYVRRNYQIRKAPLVETVAVPQKRDGVIHHLSYFVHSNTDVVILSLFSTLENVSVYAVYRTVIALLEQVLSSISSGLSGAVGNLIARDETQQLNRLVDRYEAWSNFIATAVATVCAILILPFVSIYTSGVTDAPYHQPFFALLMIGGSYTYSVRHPFGCVVSAAGHYRETKPGAIAEVAINLGLSLLLVKPLGLVGVAIGTFVAMTFRTIYTVWYLSKNILHRPMGKFLLKSIGNLAVSAISVYSIPLLMDVTASGIWELFLCAIKVSAIVFPVLFGFNMLLSIKIIKAEKKAFFGL